MTFLLISRLFLKLSLLLYTVNLTSNVFSFINENGQNIKDKIALQVINDLHSEMDINKDGEINSDEAEEFTHGQLKIQSNVDLSENMKTYLTKDLLWKSWKNSKVYNWTIDDVVTWLNVEVDLSEYTKVFLKNNINGSMIPRLALSDMSFLINILGIRNVTHRRKIARKAKDLILFGPSKNLLSTWEETEAYDVIKNLHSQLDDDKDGGVDPVEADEFARDELKYTGDFERAKRFNKNDNHISKEELWKNWKSSLVYNWTVEEVIDWLKVHVELGEYIDLFKKYKIDGSTIPRLAASDMSFLIKDLKIKNPVHRKKIVLKATDLILFGSPKKTYSFMKDSILITLVIITIGGCWLAYYQHRFSKRQIENMQMKMNQLGVAEDALTKLQARLDEAEEQNTRVSSEKQKIEEKLKSEFEKLKEEMSRDSIDDIFKYKHADDETFNLDVILPEQLKILLQMNYEVEENFFTFKKLAAHQQMQNVKDMCEKLRKKKSSLIGSLRIAHSGNLDDMDKELQEAKFISCSNYISEKLFRIAVDEVRSDLVERSQRWDYIEKLIKFKIFPTPGLPALRSAFTATINGGTNSSFPKNSMIISPSSSALSTLVSTNNNTVANATVATTISYAASNSTSSRPKNLQLYMNGCSGDSSELTDTPPSVGANDVHCNNESSMLNELSLQKLWNGSNSFSHFCIAPSPCCAFSDHCHSANGSILNSRKFSQVSLLSQAGNESRTNLATHISKVRPFAFHWLKRLDKTKKANKKCKTAIK